MEGGGQKGAREQGCSERERRQEGAGRREEREVGAGRAAPPSPAHKMRDTSDTAWILDAQVFRTQILHSPSI